jgi:hypothetical protein
MIKPKNPYICENSAHYDEGYAAGLADGEKRLARALLRFVGKSGHEFWKDWLTTRAKRRKP